jgi:hypothetical protein
MVEYRAEYSKNLSSLRDALHCAGVLAMAAGNLADCLRDEGASAFTNEADKIYTTLLLLEKRLDRAHTDFCNWTQTASKGRATEYQT